MAETKKKAVKAKKPEAEVKEPVAEEKPAKAKKAKKAEAKVEEPAPKKEVHEAVCVSKGIRVAPRKVRLVVDIVRGKPVTEALALLKAVNKVGCDPVYKAVKSAASNATNNFGMDLDSLYVAEIQCSDAFRIKRYIPRAKGSASSIIKRNTNLRVVVRERR